MSRRPKPANSLSPRETSFPSSQKAESAERKTSPKRNRPRIRRSEKPFHQTRTLDCFSIYVSVHSIPEGLRHTFRIPGKRSSSRTGGKQPPVSPHRRFVENKTGNVMSDFLGEPDKACAAFVCRFWTLGGLGKKCRTTPQRAEASTSPRGSACIRSAASSAASASMIAARACSKTCCPTWVRASLRVLRSSNRTLSRSSNRATRRLIRDFGTFNAR